MLNANVNMLINSSASIIPETAFVFILLSLSRVTIAITDISHLRNNLHKSRIGARAPHAGE